MSLIDSLVFKKSSWKVQNKDRVIFFSFFSDYLNAKMSSDWRGGSNCMTDLISKLYKRPSVESYTDISFKLPDGGTVQVRVVKKIF